MSFLAAAAPFAAAGAQVVQGVGGMMAGQHNRRELNRQAREELAVGAAQERDLRAEARARIGAQLAAQFSNGMEGGTGTALSALRQSELEAAIDAAELRRQAGARARSLRKQGKAEAREGMFSLAAGLLGGATAYGNMRNDWAQARTGTTPRPAPEVDWGN